MLKNMVRPALFLAAALVACPVASAQINFNVTYDDVTNKTGQGFDDPSVGQLRRDSVTAAFSYLNTVLDGRGTTTLNFQTSSFSGSGFLADFGPYNFATIKGSFQNGSVYQAARTNLSPFGAPDGSGQFNFGYGWNYAGQSRNASFYDMTTVAIHEITHGLGFFSATNQSGTGLLSGAVGSSNLYSGFDRYLQRGNSGTNNLFNTDITSNGYGSFTGGLDTLTNGNDPATGLFFGGKYTREVLGTSAPIYAPAGYQPGSSTSHVNDSSAVMNPSVTQDTVKRLQPYEIAMLMDIGWNVYNWKPNTNGNWLDGVSGSTLTVANSRWQTDQGIVYDGSNVYNLNSAQGQAPVLPPYGQVTSNLVLNFGGTGSTSYTSTNDLGNLRLSRLNLNSTATVAEVIQNSSGNATGTLIFGLNSDGSASVLAPKIVQQNTGAFVINTNIQINNVATQTIDGVTFAGSPGLTLDGTSTGTGLITLGGTISGNGSLTQSAAAKFTTVVIGNNTYTGGTTINGGTFLVNGQTAGNSGTGTGAVTVNGGTLGGNGTISGAVTVNGGAAGGAIRGGSTGNTNTLNIANSLNVGGGAANAVFRVEASRTAVNTATASLINLTGSGSVLNLNPGSGNKFVIDLVNGSGSLQVNESYTITLATVATPGNIQLNGSSLGANATVAASNYTLLSSAFNFTGVSLTMDSTDQNLVLSFTPVPVPEPVAVLALATGALALGRAVRRRYFEVAR